MLPELLLNVSGMTRAFNYFVFLLCEVELLTTSWCLCLAHKSVVIILDGYDVLTEANKSG